MLYDMDKGALPLKLKMDHVDRIVEVNQLAYREGGKIWIHADPVSRNDPNISSEVSCF